MDENNETVEKFELLLQQQNNNRRLGLYGGKRSSYAAEFEVKKTLNAKDVLSNVVQQIKAMQNADCAKTSKKSSINMYKCKKSAFLPVNMLSREEEPPPQKHQFETQLCTDTQLIDIVQNAELDAELKEPYVQLDTVQNALETNCGMTQEFETSFFQRSVNKPGPSQELKEIKIDPMFPILDISLKEPNLNKSLDIITSPDDGDRGDDDLFPLQVEAEDAGVNYFEVDEKASDVLLIDGGVFAGDENDTEVEENYIDVNNHGVNCISFDKSIDLDEDHIENAIETFTQVPSSPVFNIKSKRPKSRDHSPLIFNLEKFENFEKIALPVIEETANKDLAKMIINSQIFGKELFLHTGKDPILADNKIPSPIICISDDILIDKEVLEENENIYIEKDANVTSKDSPKSTQHNTSNDSKKYILKDEILFSSDEETDSSDKKITDDLPFTCALETSFYNECDVLDKTMYVGFQTASNRSIVINTESLFKAKSILDNIEEDFKTNATLTQMVKNYDEHFSAKVENPDDFVIGEGEANFVKEEQDFSPNVVDPKYQNVREPSKEVGLAEFVADDKIFSLSTTNADDFNKSIRMDVLDDLQKEVTNVEVDRNESVTLNTQLNSSVDKMQVDFEPLTSDMAKLAGHENSMDVLLNKIDTPLTSQKPSKFKTTEDKFLGFKTASNNTIPISEKAFVKTKQVFQGMLDEQPTDAEDIHKINKVEEDVDFEMKDNLDSAMQGGCNDVVIGDYRNNTDIADGKDHQPNTASKNSTKEQQQTNIFEHEKIDDEIIKEFEDDILHSEFLERSQIIETKSNFVGFKTARNKNIKISNSALAEVKKIFGVIKFDDKPEENISKDSLKCSTNALTALEKKPSRIEPKDKDILIGFKTASNKNIAISENSLAQMKLVFSDIKFDGDIQTTTNINHDKRTEIKKNYDFFPIPTTSTGFTDFKTASNKNINVSEKALKKVQYMFQDIDGEFIDKPSERSALKNIENSEFQTASKKQISISAKALEKTRKIFDNIDKDFKFEKDDSTSNHNEYPGFKTASNKNIAILNETIVKTKNKFRDLDTDLHFDKDNSKEKQDSAKIGCVDFEPANDEKVSICDETTTKLNKDFLEHDFAIEETSNDSNEPPFYGFKHIEKDIAIFEEVLAKSQKVFDKLCQKSEEYTEATAINTFKDKTEQFVGFKTANNKPVTISSQALAKSKRIFHDIENEDQDSNKESGFYSENNKQTTISENTLAKTKHFFQDIDRDKNEFKGFRTGNNKQIDVSEDALAKSKNIFKELEQSQGKEIHERLNCTPFEGFKSANNKINNISEEALAKSKRILQEFDKDQEIERQKVDCFIGFETANRKKVKVSEDALIHSRKIFQDLGNEESLLKSTDKPFLGFQTASHKKVSISEEAIEKSKKMFQDLDKEQDDTMQSLNKNDSFKGFHTASNKEVVISKEALEGSRKMLQEVDSETRNTILKQRKTFTGFQTANNKEVEISAEALAKTKHIFNDIDSDIDVCAKPAKSNFGEFIFITGNNNAALISKESLKTSRKLLDDSDNIKSLTARKDLINLGDNKLSEIDTKHNDANVIDTQVLNNFDDTLHTEDFLKDNTPMKSKRSGSPILSCPKAKKRKIFQIPYSQKVKDDKVEFTPPKAVKKQKDIIPFDSDYKKTKRYTLKDLEIIEKESTHKYSIDPYILNFTFDNLLTFEFSGARNDLKLLKSNPIINITDLKTAFLNSVNKKLVPDGWMEIHLKLILWKLISYEIRFPKTMGNICTAKHVIDQLKYRYDKELYNAERPALRKIMEKDDTPMKRLVLCVVEVISSEESGTNPDIVVTDGWYCIRATIDKMLSKLIQTGKIVVGTKLVTYGAELLANDQAVSPWEDTSSLRLKLSGNSTRRALWHARLGYHSNAAILTQLSTVQQNGGKVSKLRVFVTRVYPAMYLDKFEDGSTVTRSERLESIYQMKYESERQALLEKIYEEVQTEICDQDSQDSEGVVETGIKRKCSDSGSQLAKMMKRSKDPTEFRVHLTSSQTCLLNTHTAQQRERLLQTIQERVQDKMAAAGLNVCRNVVMLLKIRVVDVEERKDGIVVSKAMLSIWKPNEAVTEMIKEGTWIEILNVVPTAIRYSEIQLSAGRQSVFNHSKHKDSDKIKHYLDTLKRKCYTIKDLTKNPSMTTDYNEIDTAGIVFLIDPSITDFDSNKHQFQNVYFCDIEKNIISVNFWGGLKKFGFDNILDTGQVVACTNLQKRAGNTRKSIPQYRATEFSYFTKTPKNVEAREIVEELGKSLFKIDKRKFCDECILLKTNYSAKLQSDENISPYRYANMSINLSKNKVFIDSPLAQRSKKFDDNLNLTGLDFESTFKQTDTQDLSPKTLLRKKQVQQKIAKLKMYGEPPPLSPMQILNKSKNAGNAYKSPLLKSDVTSSVASDKKNLPKEENIEEMSCSPVICLNRTYSVKRACFNPVKLNFSNNNEANDSLSEIVDDFAEDFDGSPPLSLD